MHNVKKILTGLFVIAMIGAGCANPENSVTNTMPTETTSAVTTSNSAPSLSTGTGDLTLSKAEGVGDSIVEIEFTAPESITKEATGYQLLLSKDPNPTKENAGDWYELGPAHRSKLWKVKASGERYVSVCALKGEECIATSAVIKVDVK